MRTFKNFMLESKLNKSEEELINAPRVPHRSFNGKFYTHYHGSRQKAAAKSLVDKGHAHSVIHHGEYIGGERYKDPFDKRHKHTKVRYLDQGLVIFDKDNKK